MRKKLKAAHMRSSSKRENTTGRQTRVTRKSSRQLEQAALNTLDVLCCSGDIVHQVFTFLDVPSIVQASRVCKLWAACARTNTLWQALCMDMWSDKKYVPLACRDLLVKGCARRALSTSLSSAREMTITPENLCALEWSFRFKVEAGREWTRDDPWWCGHFARTVRFCADGVLRWADDHSSLFTWRLSKRCGVSVLRVRHEDLGSFPGQVLLRHSNWGFVFNSPWVVYASFPLHSKTDDAQLRDRALADSVKSWQWKEVDRYNSSYE